MSEERMRSADEIIHREESSRLASLSAEAPRTQPQGQAPEGDTAGTSAGQAMESQETSQQGSGEGQAEVQQGIQEGTPSQATEQPSSDESVDAYGNTVAKGRTYTEEEVQAMIRKRLRDRHSDQPLPPVQPEQVQVPPSEEPSWEAELGNFVERKLGEIAERHQQRTWHAQEVQKQAVFEERFTSGMEKYGDFGSVVGGKPISASMMMATRSMEDPAAFVYAACRNHPDEVERISRISDPYSQIAEMGRLEERMRRTRAVTAAPVPARRISGDAVTEAPVRNIDSLINSHAKSKISHRR